MVAPRLAELGNADEAASSKAEPHQVICLAALQPCRSQAAFYVILANTRGYGGNDIGDLCGKDEPLVHSFT